MLEPCPQRRGKRSSLRQIQAPLYLLHDRSDPYIPFIQTRAEGAALAHRGYPHDLEEFDILRHAEVTSGASLGALILHGSKLHRVLRTVLLVGAISSR